MQRRRHDDAEIELQRNDRRGRDASSGRRPTRLAPCCRVEDAARGIERLGPHRVLDRDGAPQRRRFHAAAQKQVGVDDRPDAFRIAQPHLLAARGDVEIVDEVTLEPDASTKPHVAFAEFRGDLVEPDAAWIEAQRPIDRFERVGHREMTEPAIGDHRAAGKDRIGERPVDRGGQLGASGAADVLEEPLQDAEVRFAGGLQRDLSRAHTDRAGQPERRTVADQFQRTAIVPQPHLLLIERDVQRAAVSHRVVEQAHLQCVDRSVDQQVIEIGELADEANGAAPDRGGERRQLRHEQPHVRVERAVVKAEGDFGVGLGGQGNPSGAGDREPRRRRRDVATQLLAAQRERPRHLADTFFANEHAAGAEPHVIARLIEGAAAAGREFAEPGQ